MAGSTNQVSGATPDYEQLKIDVNKNVGDYITAPHTTQGVAAQPSPSPVDTLKDFNSKYAGWLAQAEAIPNLQVRDATLSYIKHKYDVISNGAAAYRSNLVQSATQLAVDPKFTSMPNPAANAGRSFAR